MVCQREPSFVWKSFNPFPNKPRFLLVCSTNCLKTLWEKEKLLILSNFSISPRCFLPFWRSLYHFRLILNCRLQTLYVWKSLNFIVWERVRIKQIVWLDYLTCLPNALYCKQSVIMFPFGVMSIHLRLMIHQIKVKAGGRIRQIYVLTLHHKPRYSNPLPDNNILALFN